MRKNALSLVILCYTILLTACSQSTEDTLDYTGVISEGSSFGYEYTVFKEQDTFTWYIGYKGETTTILESSNNEKELQHFMNAVNNSRSFFLKLIMTVSYLLIVFVIMIFLYKKNRKMFNDGGGIACGLACIIAIYIAFSASYDLNSVLQDARFYFLRLTN